MLNPSFTSFQDFRNHKQLRRSVNSIFGFMSSVASCRNVVLMGFGLARKLWKSAWSKQKLFVRFIPIQKLKEPSESINHGVIWYFWRHNGQSTMTSRNKKTLVNFPFSNRFEPFLRCCTRDLMFFVFIPKSSFTSFFVIKIYKRGLRIVGGACRHGGRNILCNIKRST